MILMMLQNIFPFKKIQDAFTDHVCSGGPSVVGEAPETGRAFGEPSAGIGGKTPPTGAGAKIPNTGPAGERASNGEYA